MLKFLKAPFPVLHFWFLNLDLICETLCIEAVSGLLISMLEKLNWFCLTGLMTLVLSVWKKWVALEEKSSFKMLGLSFSSKLDWGSYITSITETASKKIGALIGCMKFLSPSVALYLYKSTIWPCREHCCHVSDGARSCFLELLDKLQKRISRTVGPSLAASLEPLTNLWNVASFSLFYRFYFGRCSSELAQLVSFPHSRVRSTR